MESKKNKKTWKTEEKKPTSPGYGFIYVSR
jgi:hypothetical protein